jgi:hydroxymethylpyrimidine/phosphomethylpyrimidine kinase
MLFTALTVAGSDPSGGAGIQADMNTFAALGVYGMSVIVALTAQNTSGVSAVMDIPSEFVIRQWDAVMSDIPAQAVKTGMLGNEANVRTAGMMIEKYGVQNFVLDPVMVSTSGASLLGAAAVETLKRDLVPRALVVTPNMGEAAMLSGADVHDKNSMEVAARQIRDLGAVFVLVKGGHLEGDALDILFDGSEFHYYRAARIGDAEIHGTGCVLSAAITAGLAKGNSVCDAVRLAKDFVTEAIRTSRRVGNGAFPCNAAGLKL